MAVLITLPAAARKTCLGLLLFLTAAGPATQPSDEAAPKLTSGGTMDRRFGQLHEAFLQRRTTRTRLLFLGASIVERWQTVGAGQYQRFAKFGVDDFGISGDKTQNLLWRIDHGELDGMAPEVVMIHTGNNNLDTDTAADVARGMKAVVGAVHAKLPKTTVVLMALFPRGFDPENPAVAEMREKIRRVNAELTKLDDGDRTRVLSIGDRFAGPDGLVRYGMMNDAMHPTAAAYQIWADALLPVVEKLVPPRG